jgi:hypothetical protein
MRRFLTLLALATWAASCAPVPPPASSPVPGQPPASPVPEARPSPTPAPEPEAPGLPRTSFTIGLIWDVDTLSLAPMGTARLGGPASGTIEPHERLSVRLTRQGAVARVTGPRGARQYTVWPSDTLTVVAEAQSGEGLVRWNGKSWRGELRPSTAKKADATRLPLETYLLGVILGEIGPLAGPIEAGRGTIAARNYSLLPPGGAARRGSTSIQQSRTGLRPGREREASGHALCREHRR